MSDTRKQNLKLIQEQGAEFMRSIKIHQNNKGTEKAFFIRPTIDGKVRYIAFKTEEDAKLFLGLLPKASTNPNKKTFIDYFYRIIDDIETSNTKKSYHYTLTKFRLVLNKSLSSITFEDLTQCYQAAKKSTWNQMSAVLKRICVTSQDQNLSLLLLKLDTKNRYNYKSNKREIDEPEKFIESIISFNCESNLRLEIAQIATLILCYTGIRVGELGCLTIEDIKKGQLKINKTVVDGFSYSGATAKTKTIIQNYTKGKDNRVIPLSDEVTQLFSNYFDLLKIYRGKRDNTALNRKFFSEKMDYLSKKTGIKVTPHMCRHAFGTIFGKACKNFDEVFKLQTLLGHKNLSTTQRYITLSKPTSDDIMSKMPTLKKQSKK